jgi:hypothetical protein
MGKMWEERLLDEWQLKFQYREIDPLILSTIRKRCGGNVLLCLHYFVQLLQNHLILID